MTRMISLLVTTLVVSGCGPGVLKATDDRLQVYVEMFKMEANIRGIDLPELNYLKIAIAPESSLPGLHGVCRVESGTSVGNISVKRKTILISEAAINRGEFATRVTMFHELAHCVLDMGHTEKVTNVHVYHSGVHYVGSMPTSLMTPRYFNEPQVPVAELYWNQYVDELFGKTENPFH